MTKSKIHFFSCAEKPTIKLSHESLTLKKGDKLNLSATHDGLPKPDVQWKFNDTNIDSEKVTFDAKKGKSSLALKGLEDIHAGIYSVVATNEAGESHASCVVTIEFPPQFTKQLNATKCIEGTSLAAEVQVTGNPEPEIEWFKNDELLPTSESVKIDNNRLLTIQKFESLNVGKYKVVATNSIGSAVSEANFDILGKCG